MSTPADFGFVRCKRCKAWRARLDEHGQCAELAFCSATAGVGKGMIDADTGAPKLDDDVLPGAQP